MSVTIRTFDRTRDSSAAVRAFHDGIRAWQLETGQVTVFGDGNDELDRIYVSYLFAGGQFWIVVDDATGEVVGCVGLKRTSDTTGAVKRLAVHPERHRERIATRLVAAVIDWARDAGMTEVTLITDQRENARGIYERAGFQVVGWVPDSTDQLMALDLRSSVSA
jgi:N-acetylglutamate synthase-like GNAT family acetyltransferase